MESLTRNNYEIWFLDYLDGHLSNEQLETLLDFVEQNPDLKEELREISGVSLAAGTESLDNKDLLLKTSADIPGISSIDQLCIARMENDLTAGEADQFDLRLAKDSELRVSYAAFRNTKLNPAHSIVFPYKHELRKKTVIFSPWLITAISSAAVVLLVWFLWPDNQESHIPTLAKTETPPITNPTPATQYPIPETGHLKPETRYRTTVSPDSQKPASTESMPREYVPMQSIAHKSAPAGPRIPDPQSSKLLLASNYSSAITTPLPAAEALTVPQYALQVFREKILGQDKQVVRKTRFSMWEVAGAGVDKINDLTGTNMKLSREYDTKGDILAVSFNSRLLDVESPVKGQENR